MSFVFHLFKYFQMPSHLEAITYFIFAPVQNVEYNLLTIARRECADRRVSGFSPMLSVDTSLSGLLKYSRKKAFECRDRLDPYGRYSYFTSETPMGSRKLIFGLSLLYHINWLTTVPQLIFPRNVFMVKKPFKHSMYCSP